MRFRRLDLTSESPERARELAAEIRALAPAPPEVGPAVQEILAAVRERGDEAVLDFTQRFDSDSAGGEARVPARRLQEALEELSPAVRTGLETAVRNVESVARHEPTSEVGVDLPQGQRVVLREIPVRRAGIYAPGGRAAYPSTVVMCCVPARVAGVEQLVVVTPPGPDGAPSVLVLAACALCGVEEVYAIGGAQAIAALAFGTGAVEAVDVIVGPGNHYVQEAKRQVVGLVGIDGVAGPSELVVIADAKTDLRLAALDLAAQAEHGEDSLLALISPSESLLDEAAGLVEELAREHESISAAPLALVSVSSLDAAARLAEAIAPEHLQLACADSERLAEGIRSSGCVFTGVGGGAAFGDYVAGSNHVLPTGGAARFASPLGVAQFRRRQALVSLPVGAAQALAVDVSSVARAEGFPVHAASAEARQNLSARDSK